MNQRVIQMKKSEFEKLYDSGTLEEVAKKLGISADTLANYAKKLGVKKKIERRGRKRKVIISE